MNPSISVFFPVLNEEGSVEQLTTDLLRILRLRFDTFEIIIIDDGSTDGTGEIADALEGRYGGLVRVIHRPRSSGYGNALKAGFAAARYDLVLVEGAGGLMVPITQQLLTADLIRLLDLPVIIIARTTLGTINHTLLTVKQAQSEDLEVRGIILNKTSPEPDEAEETNPAVLEKFSRVPLLGVVPYIPAKDRQNLELLSSLVCSHIDLSLLQ